MKPCLQPFLLSVGLACLLAAGPARAADSDPASLAKMVSVGSVTFGPAQTPESTNGSWNEADVELLIVPTPTQLWADHVKVTITVAYTVEGHAKTFRSSAEAVALDAGSPHFRFYLPPEVVREFKLQDTPNFWAVELSVGGVKLPGSKKNVSTSIATPDQLSKLLAAGTENNGILVPQFLSPFAHDSSALAPSFMRPEAAPGGPGGANN